MKIRLWDKPNDSYSAEQQILHNRGIDIKDQQRWITASPSDQYSWIDFGDEMKDAVYLVRDIVEDNKKIAVVVDADMDGATSSAILFNYLYKRYPEYIDIYPILHEGKQHGLADVMDKITDDTDLVICPDGASNDIEQHNELYDKNIQCLVLDHHSIDIDKADSRAIIVNVQSCPYPDKNLSGAGVVWRFVQAYEDLIIHGNQPDEFADLAAWGNLSDMMDYRELEIRSIVVQGLSNLHNHFMIEMAKAHSYIIEKRNGLNYNSAAFGLTPFGNAVSRSGTMEEKEFVFKAMLDKYADELVPNSKRGHKGEMCRRCEEAVTVAERVKRRQTQIQEQETGIVKRKIEENNLDDHSIILALLEPDEGEPNINGLTATQISAKYQKPSAVLIRKETDEGVSWVGSMRNAPNAEKDDLRAELEKTGEVEFVAGHSNAGGLEIKDENIQEFLRRFDEQYKDVDMERRFMVDYDWSMGRVDEREILDIAHLNIYGQGIPESLVSVHDINLSSCKIQLLGARRNTVKITLPNDVSIMKFQTDEDFFDSLSGDDKYLNIVGKPGDNFYNGVHYPQIIMEDYEILDDWYVF